MSGVSGLRFAPVVSSGSPDEGCGEEFNRRKPRSSLLFFDVFGYPRLFRSIVRQALAAKECDCLFMFDFHSIDWSDGDMPLAESLCAILTHERLTRLRSLLSGHSRQAGESIILEVISEELKALGGRYVLPFSCRKAANRLLPIRMTFMCKSFRGYDLVKNIIANDSLTGVRHGPTFLYASACSATPLLQALQRSPDTLWQTLLDDLSGLVLPPTQIYLKHSIDTPFVERHYREALARLQAERYVQVTSTLGRPLSAGTFSDHVRFHFP